MKIKNVIFENKQYFETIGKIHESEQPSVMDAYRINRLVKKLNELNTEYDELKQKIFTQYGKPGEKEGTYEVGPENREAFAGILSTSGSAINLGCQSLSNLFLQLRILLLIASVAHA